MLRTRGVGGDERQVQVGLKDAREFNLRLLRRLSEPLQRHLVVPHIDSRLCLELFSHIIQDCFVHVGAAELCVAARGKDLEDALAELHNCYIERAAAEVEDQNLLLLLGLVNSVSERRGCRLVDYSDNL